MADGGSTVTFSPERESARAFRDALGKFTTGITIVTCASAAGPVGITANSFASVSLDPPLVLWSPARASRRFAAFEAATHYAIHVLAEDQRDLCAHFTRNGMDFDGVDWTEGAFGVPRLSGCLARFDCVQTARHDGGDHLIIVGRVLTAAVRDSGPLVFSCGRYGRFSAAH